jgi:predicted RNA-binding protein YlxR (DUF448 family)
MVEAPERSAVSDGGPEGLPRAAAPSPEARAGKSAVRRDLASRASGEARTMLRFVIDPERRLLPDLTGRLPGRGFWVEADAASVRKALKKRVFDRHAGGAVVVPDDLPALLERLLVQRCMDAVGLGKRAGDLVSGFDQVAAALAANAAGVLIEASDAALHGRRKLRAKQGDGPVVAALSRAELGRALGRDAVVHAWMRNGRLATRLADDAARLAGFRRPPDHAGDEDADAGGPRAGERRADEQQGIRRAG